MNSNATFGDMNNEVAESKGFHFSKLLNYFLQGLLVIAPIAITIYAVYSVVSFIDNQVPIFTAKAEDGKVYVRNYGLGFLIVIIAIILIGYVSSFFIKNRVFNLFDSVLKRTPGIRFIYSTTKQFCFFRCFCTPDAGLRIGGRSFFIQQVHGNLEELS